MEDKKNKVEYRGVLELGDGISIPCYVLADGRRVLSGRKMQEALKMVDDADTGKRSSGARLSRYLNQKSLSTYLYDGKEVGHFDPIVCYDGTQRVNGYEATVLADICDAFLAARKVIDLSPRQKIVADQCEVLMRAFAKTGIIALVDEATGYQYDRERDELQKILRAYISEELLPWQKRFPDIFYTELFRLNGWDYTVNGIKKRPGVIGKWTNTLVYEELPHGVLDALKQKTPVSDAGNRTARYHQSLTPDVGEPNLSAQINKIITLFKISNNMRELWFNFKRLKEREAGQLALPFPFDEEGHTKEE